MEYEIEFSGTITQEMCQTLYGRTLKKRTWILTSVLLILAVIYLIMGITEKDVAAVVVAVMEVIFAVVIWRMPYSMGKRVYKGQLKLYDGVIPESTACFGDQIFVKDVDSSQTIAYDKLAGIHISDDCVILNVGKQKMIALPMQKFAKGSLPELKAFLRRKRPDLKIPE